MTFEPLIAHFESYLPFTEEEKLLISERVSWRKLKRHEYIIQSGEICRYYTFVVNGIIRIHVTDNEGKEHNILVASEGDWISDIDSFHARHPASPLSRLLSHRK